jgi:hypothetical protein
MAQRMMERMLTRAGAAKRRIAGGSQWTSGVSFTALRRASVRRQLKSRPGRVMTGPYQRPRAEKIRLTREMRTKMAMMAMRKAKRPVKFSWARKEMGCMLKEMLVDTR